MEQKTARLTLLIDPDKKRALEQWCAEQDTTPSRLVRQLIRDHLKQHGVSWHSGGLSAALPSPDHTEKEDS